LPHQQRLSIKALLNRQKKYFSELYFPFLDDIKPILAVILKLLYVFEHLILAVENLFLGILEYAIFSHNFIFLCKVYLSLELDDSFFERKFKI
jgi:hypothetical protein